MIFSDIDKTIVTHITISYNKIGIFKVDGLSEQWNVDGIWYGEHNAILFDSSLTGLNLFETILHEILHAVSDIAGFDWEEMEVCTTGTLLTQALQGILKCQLELSQTF